VDLKKDLDGVLIGDSDTDVQTAQLYASLRQPARKTEALTRADEIVTTIWAMLDE
jgi:hypothetical protein